MVVICMDGWMNYSYYEKINSGKEAIIPFKDKQKFIPMRNRLSSA